MLPWWAEEPSCWCSWVCLDGLIILILHHAHHLSAVLLVLFSLGSSPRSVSLWCTTSCEGTWNRSMEMWHWHFHQFFELIIFHPFSKGHFKFNQQFKETQVLGTIFWQVEGILLPVIDLNRSLANSLFSVNFAYIFITHFFDGVCPMSRLTA